MPRYATPITLHYTNYSEQHYNYNYSHTYNDNYNYITLRYTHYTTLQLQQHYNYITLHYIITLHYPTTTAATTAT